MEYYSIGKLSKKTNLSPDALRYYDEIGLLKPEHVDALSGYRYYTDDSILTLVRIAELKEFGISLRNIKEILQSGCDLKEVYNLQYEKLVTQRAQLDATVKKLAKKLAHNKGEDRMNKTLLLVDDAAIMRMMLKDILEKSGYKTIEAENGIRGLEMYKTHKPDAVLMDIAMPELEGIEATRKIMEHDKNAKIIMVSAVCKPRKIAEALLAGAQGFVAKPFSSEFLFKVIDDVFLSDVIFNVNRLDWVKTEYEKDESIGQNIVDAIIGYAKGETNELLWNKDETLVVYNDVKGLLNSLSQGLPGGSSNEEQIGEIREELKEIKDMLKKLTSED